MKSTRGAMLSPLCLCAVVCLMAQIGAANVVLMGNNLTLSFDDVEANFGVLLLIHHLHANRIPICVAIGSHERHFALKTQNHQEMFAVMHHVVMGDDPEVKAGKPSLDIFLATMTRFEALELLFLGFDSFQQRALLLLNFGVAAARVRCMIVTQRWASAGTAGTGKCLLEMTNQRDHVPVGRGDWSGGVRCTERAKQRVKVCPISRAWVPAGLWQRYFLQ